MEQDVSVLGHQADGRELPHMTTLTAFGREAE